MRNYFPIFIIVLTAILGGCTNMQITKYTPPHIDYPAHWQSFRMTTAQVPFDWQDFHDPLLEHWLQQVINNNNDLAISLLRVYQAELASEQAHIQGGPQFSGNLDTKISQSLPNVADTNKSSSFHIEASYELDLWGKLARQRDAAEWAHLASKEDLAAARLLLLTKASKNYWQIAFLNQRIVISQHSIDYANYTSRLVKARYRAGSVTELDAIEAQQNILIQESSHQALLRSRIQALNMQAALLGRPPGSTIIEPLQLPEGTLPQINPGIPTIVLSRRPDVSAKELRLRQSLADIDVKRTQYYPSFALTGDLGSSSAELLEFMSHPAALFSASLTLPFLQWQQKDLDVKNARNIYSQRELEFKQTLYQAMGDVEDGLALRNQLITQEAQVQDLLRLARKSERLNEIRYRSGASPIIFWLTAQEKRRQAELQLDTNRYEQLQNLAQLYLEFGGNSLHTL